MRETDFFSLFTDKLEIERVPYMVTGSAVVVAYGEPRLTNDIDLVLDLDLRQALRLGACFDSFSYSYPIEETLRAETSRESRGHFNIIHYPTGLKADCYLAGGEKFLHWGLSARKPIILLGHQVHFAPLEYVIIKKLQFYQEGRSEKHLRDIKGLLAVSNEKIDQKLLAGFVSEFKLDEPWSKVLPASRESG